MRENRILIGLVIALVVLLGACRSEFERVRTSGDPELVYKRANEFYDAQDYQRAQALYELVISNFRGRPEAEQISFRYAYTYYYLRQYLLAAYYFNNFAQTYGGSRYKEEADYMSAYSNYELSPNFRLDQTNTLKAIDAFQEFINQYPNSERVVESNRLIDEMRAKLETKEVESAKLYFDLQQYQSAIQSFENVLKDYPDTDAAEELRYYVVRSNYLWASNSFVERQAERFEEVVARATEFLNRYQSSSFQADVSRMLSTAQERLKQLEDVRYKSTGTGS